MIGTMTAEITRGTRADDVSSRLAGAGGRDHADTAWPGTPPTRVEVTTRWPPYALPDGSPLRDALLEAAAWAGLAPTAKVAGLSNIGN